ncbi:MAG: type III secretion system chaperone [Chthoniobacterales bacterium]
MNPNFQNQAETILESLGKILGFDQLEFDTDDDTCLLVLDGEIEIAVTLNEENSELILHHQIGTLPERNRYDIVERLLEANLFWSGTRGATLSMERTTGVVIIAKAVGLYDTDGVLLTGEELGSAIVNLAEVATHWGKLLGSDASEEASTTRKVESMIGKMFA